MKRNFYAKLNWYRRGQQLNWARRMQCWLTMKGDNLPTAPGFPKILNVPPTPSVEPYTSEILGILNLSVMTFQMSALRPFPAIPRMLWTPSSSLCWQTQNYYWSARHRPVVSNHGSLAIARQEMRFVYFYKTE